jgi:hypothetical protein
MMSKKIMRRITDSTAMVTFLKNLLSPLKVFFRGTKIIMGFRNLYSPINIAFRGTKTVLFVRKFPECFMANFTFIKESFSILSFNWRRFTNFANAKFSQVAFMARQCSKIFSITAVTFISSFHNNVPLKKWMNSGKPVTDGAVGNPEPSQLSNHWKVHRLRMTRLTRNSIAYIVLLVKGIIPNSVHPEREEIVGAIGNNGTTWVITFV